MKRRSAKYWAQQAYDARIRRGVTIYTLTRVDDDNFTIRKQGYIISFRIGTTLNAIVTDVRKESV